MAGDTYKNRRPKDCIGPRAVTDRTGLTYRQLSYWAERGFLAPYKFAGRTRAYLTYAPEHVAALVVLAELRERGRSIQSMYPLTRSLVEEFCTSRHPEDWQGAFLVVVGAQWAVQWSEHGRYPDGDLAAWWAGVAPAALVVDLGAAWRRAMGEEAVAA